MNTTTKLINEDFTLSGDTCDLQIIQNDITLVFTRVDSILIPKKIEYNLRKYVSKYLLKEIDSDINIAIEKCLVIISNFSSTFFTDDKFKSLSSEQLHQQTKNTNDNTYIYKKILNLLKIGTSTGAMIEVDTNEDGIETYSVGNANKRYKLSDSYLNVGLVNYQLKTKSIIQKRNKDFFKQLELANQNTICKNLIKTYQQIDLPTNEELLKIGKQLVKDGYTTKKGKKLTVRNKNKNSHWIDSTERSFVEDDIKLFDYLTGRGFMIPSAGDEKSGGRVVDSFTLMPSWIRKEITIDGTKLKEADYTALHPNIAIKLYGGKESYITHQKVAENALIDVNNVKIEHLSFFNKHWNGMLTSPLFNYYANNETEMMENIFRDKQQNGYKITSRKLFKAEVEVMTTVIDKLNAVGIYVLYVYDALICKPEDESIVIEIMDKVILEFGIKTEVKKEQIIDMVEANAFADDFVSKMITKSEDKIKQEIEAVNDVDNLLQFLENSPIKYINKIFIGDDIKNGTILTLKQLEDRIAS